MKVLTRLFLLFVLAGACLLLMTGCGKEPARVNIALNAALDVNPDPSGQALSVVVRIYQLKDPGRLETADYFAIWKSDKETLADDYLERQERVIQPGTQNTIEIRRNPQALYLGIVALFRNPTGDTWRRIIPLRGKNPKINLSLHGQNIDISSVDE
jgi:type VI secretion system protein VasD